MHFEKMDDAKREYFRGRGKGKGKGSKNDAKTSVTTGWRIKKGWSVKKHPIIHLGLKPS